MRKWWQWDQRVWSEDMPMGGGEAGEGMEGTHTTEDTSGQPAVRRSREVEGGADIGGQADPGRIRGDVSYVNEPPETIIGRVGGGGGAVPLTEGGDMSTGPVSEGGSDTGPTGNAQAGGAANTGGVGGDVAEGL